MTLPDQKNGTGPRIDERMLIERQHTAVGLLGPRSSSFTLAWLATHRGRLRTLLCGFKRLSVLVVWDRKGGELVAHDDVEVACLRRIVYGPEESAASDEGSR